VLHEDSYEPLVDEHGKEIPPLDVPVAPVTRNPQRTEANHSPVQIQIDPPLWLPGETNHYAFKGLQVPKIPGLEGSVLSTDSSLPAAQEPSVEFGTIVARSTYREVVLGDTLPSGDLLERLRRLAPKVLGGLFRSHPIGCSYIGQILGCSEQAFGRLGQCQGNTRERHLA
jgi:hypothetical protein